LWLEDSGNCDLRSLEEIRQIMVDRCGDESEVYGSKQLKNLLLDRYGSNVFLLK
jgi:hypothetical protein